MCYILTLHWIRFKSFLWYIFDFWQVSWQLCFCFPRICNSAVYCGKRAQTIRDGFEKCVLPPFSLPTHMCRVLLPVPWSLAWAWHVSITCDQWFLVTPLHSLLTICSPSHSPLTVLFGNWVKHSTSQYYSPQLLSYWRNAPVRSITLVSAPSCSGSCLYSKNEEWLRVTPFGDMHLIRANLLDILETVDTNNSWSKIVLPKRRVLWLVLTSACHKLKSPV